MSKIILIILSVILAVALVFVGITFAYYPHYIKNRDEVECDDILLADGFNVMSYNIRCMNPMDMGKKSWFYRADLVVDLIEDAQPAIIGFQEATKWQYNYLYEALDDYDSIITYRDDAYNSEGCPLFYRTDLFTLVDKGSFWLSETPEKMSKDWGAACYRICSYVILEDKTTGGRFAVFNTHLDHISDTARINGIKVVLDKIKEFNSLPAILMGDMNSRETSETYKSATEFFLDTKYQTENTMTSCTYQNWGKELDRNCIDYIFTSKSGFKVNSYKVERYTHDGIYLSDHFPICVNVSFDSQG